MRVRGDGSSSNDDDDDNSSKSTDDGDACRDACARRRLVVALCASAKKHAQSFDALRHYACTKAAAAAATAATTNGTTRACDVRFVTLHYDATTQRMTLRPPSDHASTAATHRVTSDDDDNDDNDDDDVNVDVVLHKVTTFADAAAMQALERWCDDVTTRQRARRRAAPLVVVDACARVRRVTSRVALYTRLSTYDVCQLCDTRNNSNNKHRYHDDDSSVRVRIPRSYVWTRGTRTVVPIASAATTTTHKHAHNNDDNDSNKRSNGGSHDACTQTQPQQRRRLLWWLAKPDEATGPAYTHYFVVWCSTHAQARAPPRRVQALLPPSPVTRMVLQQLCVHAVPVVVKVYVMGSAMHVDVRPTADFLARLRPTTTTTTTTTNNRSADDDDDDENDGYGGVALCINSQDSSVFCARARGVGDEHSNNDCVDINDDDDVVRRWSSPAVARCWADYFAPDTRAYRTLAALAAHLARDDVCGLSLYGFDVLLLPPSPSSLSLVAHIDDNDDDDAALWSHANVTSSTTTTAACGGVDVLPVCACFDVVRGEATALLRSCVPVLVDVNYFPGYKGVTQASAQLLALLQDKAAAAAANEATNDNDGSAEVSKAVAAQR